jgi:adenine phosphoribosyltransferase
VIDRLTERVAPTKPDIVIGIEARGFIFAPALAYHLGAGFVPVRKPKKLPSATERVSYELEYGVDTLEVHRDAISKGTRVLIADDLLATGGTAAAAANLVEKLGGEVAGYAFVVELDFLKGRERLSGYTISSLIRY